MPTEHQIVLDLADTSHELGFFGNVFIRRIPVPKGVILPGHTHQYDHASFVGTGRVQVYLRYADGHVTQKQYDGPDWFEVPARAYHEVQGLTEAVLFCVFAVRDPSGEIAEMVQEDHVKRRKDFTR